jgi:hypothetical protein
VFDRAERRDEGQKEEEKRPYMDNLLTEPCMSFGRPVLLLESSPVLVQQISKFFLHARFPLRLD